MKWIQLPLNSPLVGNSEMVVNYGVPWKAVYMSTDRGYQFLNNNSGRCIKGLSMH
jgi:hypothetical protein